MIPISLFVVLLLIGTPIAFVLGLTACTHLVTMGGVADFSVVIQRLFAGLNNSSFMCIPFFVLAGNLMNKTGITEKIIAFTRELVSTIRGGMAYVVVLVAMFLSAVLGSANAVTAILCSMLIPYMVEDGFDEDFSAGLIAGSGVLGPVIPPSVPFVIYGSLAGLSVSKLFLGGVVPGLLIGLGNMIVIMICSRKRSYKRFRDHYDLKALLIAFVKAIPALMIPVIIIGGILSGIFTPTESGAVACGVAVISGIISRKLKIGDFISAAVEAAITTGSIMIIIAFGNILGWTLALDQVPASVVSFIGSITNSWQVVMLLIIGILMVVGCVMDGFSALYIFAPVMITLTSAYGIDQVHFGLIFNLIMNVGLITPPVGMVLFIASNVSGVPFHKLCRTVLPFTIVSFVVAFALAFLPQITLWLPNLLS